MPKAVVHLPKALEREFGLVKIIHGIFSDRDDHSVAATDVWVHPYYSDGSKNISVEWDFHEKDGRTDPWRQAISQEMAEEIAEWSAGLLDYQPEVCVDSTPLGKPCGFYSKAGED